MIHTEMQQSRRENKFILGETEWKKKTKKQIQVDIYP